MASVSQLLRQIKDGTTTAEEVAAEVARLCKAGLLAEEAEVEGMARKDVILGRMAGSLPDRTGIDTFMEVTAAHIGGSITDEQHAVLHEAYMKEMGR